MYRDNPFGLVVPAALVLWLPAAAHAQTSLQTMRAAIAHAPFTTGAPASADYVTGAIPKSRSAALTPPNANLPAQSSMLAPPPSGETTPSPSPATPESAVLSPETESPHTYSAPAEAPQAAPSPATPTTATIVKPLTGFAAAVKKALDAWTMPAGKGRAAAELWLEHKDIVNYYAARDYAALWVADGKPTAAVPSIKARLAHAGDDGLNLAAFSGIDFSGDTDHLAAAEVALSEEIVAYGRQASGCRIIDPQDINPLIGAKPDVAAPGLILGAVAAADLDGGDVLQHFNPQQKPYLALRAKLATLPQRSNEVPQAEIPRGPSLRVGMSDPRVPLIRARLGLDVTQSDDDLIYDTQVAAAVADFQRANGINPSGVFTQRTLASLDGISGQDLRNDIIANMEAWRWMPRDLGQNRIDVNIPDFEVRVIRDGKVVAENKVVVGKPSTPTPIFSNTMKFLIVNPYWNIPPSILRKEMLPHLAQDPSYFQRMGYETFYLHGHLVVRQPPGEKNALGQIKFMFPNQYSVYLHDTPQRRFFAASQRAFSHGCVRVDQPFDFAETLLGAKWPEDRLKSLIGDKEHYVFLPKPLPIHLEYFTAYVNEEGNLILRGDVYGYEHKIEKALGLAG